MVRRIDKPITTAPGHTTQVQKKPTHLKELKAKTNTFMMKKGGSLLGAGKPPTISDKAPSKSSKRVAQAAGPMLSSTSKKTRSR